MLGQKQCQVCYHPLAPQVVQCPHCGWIDELALARQQQAVQQHAQQQHFDHNAAAFTGMVNNYLQRESRRSPGGALGLFALLFLLVMGLAVCAIAIGRSGGEAEPQPPRATPVQALPRATEPDDPDWVKARQEGRIEQTVIEYEIYTDASGKELQYGDGIYATDNEQVRRELAGLKRQGFRFKERTAEVVHDAGLGEKRIERREVWERIKPAE